MHSGSVKNLWNKYVIISMIPMNFHTTGPVGHRTLCRIAAAVMVAAFLLCAGVVAVPADTSAVQQSSPPGETDDGLFAPLFRFFASLFSGPADDSPSPGVTPAPAATDSTPEATPAPAAPALETTAEGVPETTPSTAVPQTAPASLPPVTGGILVETVPSGAWITLDGDETGKQTPAIFAGLRDGVHRIEVSSTGFGDARSDRAWVCPGSMTPVFFDFTAGLPETTVQVESATGAPVTFAVNGKLPTLTTPAAVTVSDTETFVTVTSDEGYQTYPVDYHESDSPLLLTPAAGGDCTIQVTSDPAGARIMVDGKETGETTPAEITGLSEGPHRVVCSCAGYCPDEQVVTVAKRSGSPDAEVACTLEGYANGGIRVISEPAGAKVYLYGSYTGLTTPATIPDLPIGTYWVALSMPGFETGVQEVTVAPDTVTPYTFRLLN